MIYHFFLILWKYNCLSHINYHYFTLFSKKKDSSKIKSLPPTDSKKSFQKCSSSGLSGEQLIRIISLQLTFPCLDGKLKRKFLYLYHGTVAISFRYLSYLFHRIKWFDLISNTCYMFSLKSC